MELTRRNAIKTLGVGVVGGIGATTAFGGSAAAMTSRLSAANPGTVSNDRGDVSEVYVAPKVYTAWENFDEVPLKLRYVLEAGIDGTGFKPVYRETPWLFTDSSDPAGTATHGTTDRYPDGGRAHLLSKNSDFYTLDGGVPVDGDGNRVTPKIVLFKEGLSNYYDEAADYPDESHWTGASLGSDAGAYANGNYGVLGDTSALDAPEDGDRKSTTIHLRLTTALLDGDSESVMQDEYPDYSGSAGYTYERLHTIAPDHPAVSVTQASFTVTANNEVADSKTNGAANPGAR